MRAGARSACAPTSLLHVLRMPAVDSTQRLISCLSFFLKKTILCCSYNQDIVLEVLRLAVAILIGGNPNVQRTFYKHMHDRSDDTGEVLLKRLASHLSYITGQIKEGKKTNHQARVVSWGRGGVSGKIHRPSISPHSLLFPSWTVLCVSFVGTLVPTAPSFMLPPPPLPPVC